jgi:hypothetical protein
MTDDELRAITRAMSNAIKQEMGPYADRVGEMESAIEELREHVAEQDRVLGIEHGAYNDLALDAMAGNDDGVFWTGMEDQRITPIILLKMMQRQGDAGR